MHFKLYISVSFVIVLTLILLSGFNECMLYALIASLMHEMGHLILIVAFGGRVEGIRLKAFAAEIKINERQFTYKREALISLGGPIMNILSGIISLRLFGINTFAVTSVLLGGFHLLPVDGMDGGNAVKAVIFEKGKGIKVFKIISLLFTLLLLLFGMYVFYITRFNFSCIIMALILIFEGIAHKK